MGASRPARQMWAPCARVTEGVGYCVRSDARARLPRSSKRVAHQAPVSFPRAQEGVGMEHQDHRVSVQFGRPGDSGSGTHLAVPHRRQAGGGATAPRRHPVARDLLGASVTSMDRYPPLRETMRGLRGSRLLLIAGILVAPLVIMGYVGLTVLLFLPLLGLRRMFPRRYTPSRLCPDDDAPPYSGVANPWGAATRTA